MLGEGLVAERARFELLVRSGQQMLRMAKIWRGGLGFGLDFGGEASVDGVGREGTAPRVTEPRPSVSAGLAVVAAPAGAVHITGGSDDHHQQEAEA